jgi:thioredoxin 1
VNQRSSQEATDREQPESAGQRSGGTGNPKVWQKAAIGLVVLAAATAIIVIKSLENRTAEEGRGLAIAAKFPPESVVATIGGEPLTLGELDLEWGGLPEDVKASYAREKDKFMEDLILRKLLVGEAERLKLRDSAEYKEALSEHEDHPGHEKEALIAALIKREAVGKIQISDEELRELFQKREAASPSAQDFEAVKEELRGALQAERQDNAIERYVSELLKRTEVTRNEKWIGAMQALSKGNPLDQALGRGKPIVADFGKGTCTPCKVMKTILDALAKEYEGKAEMLVLDIRKYPMLADRCGVRFIPTQVFYDGGGNEVYRHEGPMTKDAIRSQLAKLGVK